MAKKRKNTGTIVTSKGNLQGTSSTGGRRTKTTVRTDGKKTAVSRTRKAGVKKPTGGRMTQETSSRKTIGDGRKYTTITKIGGTKVGKGTIRVKKTKTKNKK